MTPTWASRSWTMKKLTKDLDHLDLELKQDEAKTCEIAELSSHVGEVTQKLG